MHRPLCPRLNRAPGAPADHRQPALRLAGLGLCGRAFVAAEHVFRDEGYSGSRLDRPGLDALRRRATTNPPLRYPTTGR